MPMAKGVLVFRFDVTVQNGGQSATGIEHTIIPYQYGKWLLCC